nr:hypothetical protein HYD84_01560 [Mycoplasmopsis bovis]
MLILGELKWQSSEIRQVERPKNTVEKYFGKLKLKKNQQINGKAIQKIWQCANSRLQICSFETPIPVGTRSKKSKKQNKRLNIAILQKIARYFGKN